MIPLYNKSRANLFVCAFFFTSILSFSQNDPIYGCTEPLACNYNPDATINDGSCQYGICGVDCVDFEVSGSPSNDWSIVDSNGSTVYQGNSNNIYQPFNVCLDPNECYQVYMTGSDDVNINNYGEWTIDDGSGSVILDDVMYPDSTEFVPTVGNDYEVKNGRN